MPTCLFAHPGSELFGSDRMLLESVTGAVEAGMSCVVAIPEQGPLVAELLGAGARVVIAPTLVLRKSLLKPRGWPRLIRDLLRGLGSAWRLIATVGPDVLYVSTITIPLWPLVARLRGVPSLTHIHEAEASGSRLVNVALYAPHSLSRGIVVNSEFARQTLAGSMPRLARRARVVYNGVAAPDSPPPPRDAPTAPVRLLYLGRLSPRKGTDLVIDAAIELENARGIPTEVTLLGSVFAGYEWYEQELHDKADSAALKRPVRFLGFHPDVWSAIAAADVVVVPSRVDEPFGNTAVEGVLGLRPVVASDSSGLREAAGGYSTTRLVGADDAGAIADAVAELVDGWSEVRVELPHSRQVAIARHSPSTYRRRIGESLRELLAPGAAGGSSADSHTTPH